MAFSAVSFIACNGKDKVKLATVQVTPPTPDITMDQTQQFQATGIYTDAATEDITSIVTWSSSDEGVATVDENGLATPVAPGETTITAEYQGISGSATLTVTSKELERLEVDPATATLAIGTTQQLNAVGYYSDGSTEDLTNDADWSSSDDAVATVSGTGLVDGVAEGTATVTATVGSFSDTATINVLGVGVTCDDLNIGTVSGETTVPAGMTRQFTADCDFSDGVNRVVTSQVDWTSSDSGVATISNDLGSEGLLTGVAAGTSDISAVFSNADGSTTDSNTVTVTVTDAEVEEIQVTPVSEASHGEDVQYTATCIMSDGSDYGCTADVTWASSDEAVATVSNAAGSEGLATALSSGTTTVTAQLSGVTSNGAILVVVLDECVSIDVQPTAPDPLPIGAVQAFTATCTYGDGSTGVVTADVTWASSDAGVATISNATGTEGEAAGVAAGATNITAVLGSVTSADIPLTVTDAAPESLAIEPAPGLTIPVGATDDFTALVTYTDGSVIDVTADAGCAWSSDNTAIATVSAGTVTGVAAGNANVSATYASLSDSRPVTIIPAALESIDVQPPTATVPIGGTQDFIAMGTYTDGSVLNITTSVTWTSSDTGIATVSNALGEEGRSEGVAAGGPVTITATRGGVSGTAQLTVSTAAIESINVTPALPDNLPIGMDQPFEATCTYTDATTLPCTTTVNWASSDTGVAAISSAPGTEGVATGVALGVTQITASSGSVTSPPVALRVVDAVLTEIQVDPDPGAVPAGFSLSFTAMGIYSDGSNRDMTLEVNWSSSDDAVASISNLIETKGRAYGNAPGSVIITALDPVSSFSGNADMDVTTARLSNVQLTPVNLELGETETYQFVATGFFTDGSTLDITEDASFTGMTHSGAAGWSISNAPGSRGLFTAGVFGRVEIYCSALGLWSNSSYIDILSSELDHLVVSLEDNDMPIGFNVQAHCEAYYVDGRHNEVTDSSTWSSDVTTVATVSNSPGSEGLVSALGEGSANIECAFGGETASMPFRVHDCALTAVDVDPDDPTASIGTTVHFTARGFYGGACADWFDITDRVTWTSFNTAVATISNAPGTEGEATVVASTGFTDIEGRLDVLADTSRLTATSACIDSIYVSPADPSLPVGVDVHMQAYGCLSTDPSCTSPVTISDADINWQTSDPTIASVAADGVVTGGGAGAATITATLTTGGCAGGEQGTSDVTVTDATLQSIDISPDDQTIGRGEDLQYTALGTYSDGSVHDITIKVTWDSTIDAVATISAAGLATADSVTEGTTTITAAMAAVTDHTSLTVSGRTLSSLEVSVTPLDASGDPEYPVGIFVQFTCTATYSDASTADVTASATFNSDNTTVLFVDNSAATKGRGTTQAVGSADVTCNIGSVDSPDFAVTVDSAALQTIDVTPDPVTINKGIQQQFAATGNYSDGESFVITKRCTWSSSNTAIATVSNTEPTQGLATASLTNEGNVTITAIYGGTTGTASLTVGGACVDHIEVTPTSTSVIAGYNTGFTATAVFSDSSSSNVTATAAWRSSNEAVATVAGGVAHGEAAGACQIIAEYTINLCSGSMESDSGDLTVNAAELTGITVNCDETNVPPGLRTQCHALGSYSDGTSGVDITDQVSWSSTNPGVATISNTDPDKGLVQAIAHGSAIMTATRGTIQGNQTVDVPDCTLQTIDVTPNSESIPVDFTVQYSATGTWSGACGSFDISAFVVWSSTNTGVATISSGGLATAVAAGDTTITASYLSINGTEPLNVNDATLSNIDVEDPNNCSNNLAKGLTCKLEARGYFSDGSNRLVSEEATWSSNTTSVATVSNTPGDRGLVTAQDAGSSVITAQVGTHTDNLIFTVSSACLQTIEVTPVDPSYPVDVPVTFVATGIYSDISTATLTGSVSWDSSDTDVVGVPDSGGLALTGQIGSATVSAQFSTNTCTGNPVTGTTDVSVTSATLNSIDVTPADPDVPDGLTQQFSAFGNYSDTSRHNITTRVTWISANTGVATISNAPGERGLATAVNPGATLISATKNLITGSTYMNVTPAVLQNIIVTTDPPYLGYDMGDTVRYPEGGLQLQFQARGLYSDGSSLNITDSVEWSSNDESAATVSTGLITTGDVSSDTTARITAASGSISGYLDIVVMNGAPTIISIVDGENSIALGSSTQWNCLAAMGAYQYIVTRSTVWSSDDTGIATVSNAEGEWGMVTGQGIGATTIWADWSTLTTNRGITVTDAVLSWVEVVPSPVDVQTEPSYQTPFTVYIIGHYTDSSTQDLTYDISSWYEYDDGLLDWDYYCIIWPWWCWGDKAMFWTSMANCDNTTYIKGCVGGLCSDAAHDAQVNILCP